MNLEQTVKNIRSIHKQAFIPLNEFDYIKNAFVEKLNPKYLFRGEKIYPTTKSNYHRNPIKCAEQEYILNISDALYKEFIGEIDKESPEYNPNIIQIGAILQHYGFSIMWLDFTESIEVAAFFASYKNNSGKGRIWVTETKELIEQNHHIYKLEFQRAVRPERQKAYALRMYDDCPDFQNNQFFNSVRYDFDLTDDDLIKFDNQILLNTLEDTISDFIIQHIESHRIENERIMERLVSIQDALKSKRIILNFNYYKKKYHPTC